MIARVGKSTAARGRRMAGLLVVCVGLAATPAVRAQMIGIGADPLAAPTTEEYAVSVGLGAGVRPDFIGGDELRAEPVPIVGVRFGEFAFAVTGRGVGMNLIMFDGLSAGPFLDYSLGSERSRAADGLDDLDGAGVAGLFVRYSLMPLVIEARVGHSFAGDIDGYVATLSGAVGFELAEGWRGRAGTTVLWGGDGWSGAFFGIDDGEASRSGLPAYRPGSGIQEVSLFLGSAYDITPSVSLVGYVRASRLVGEAADSPIIEEEGAAGQIAAQLGLVYHF
ncbi:MipA/OmpV family protein [Inquilinus limosus]|uniref:MipA/OmpV family protein n=1 Tax=Inquilinus limosus TaxID=171674 RepID=UPI003F17242D